MLCEITRKAMGTEFVIMLHADSVADSYATDAAVEAADLVEQIERELTVYSPESEISKINASAFQEPVRPSVPTYRLLKRAVELSQITSGAFDITAAPLVETWGFTRRSGRKPSPEQVQEALSKVGYQSLILNDSDGSVAFKREGMSINMGAIGKGDALDRMAALLKEKGVADFLIHGGNSSVIASGNQHPESTLGWSVGLAHPTKPQRRLAGLWLKDLALATSGSGKQFFHHHGRRYGHVIDPRTGYPNGDLSSLTIAMPSATDADAIATALFVEGAAKAAEYHAANPFPFAIMTHSTDQQDRVEVETLGEIGWIEEPGTMSKPG
ncbi:Thiamine biosynthesis lipoprotein ApbE precursor [Novipirellula aureliae]|uniref:FAD:protein FMN transferase n=1 Tax=Novipirellula aureliae TaxID=2527966 RepID=A0A5C6E5Z9_9BACT|nr:FAD:protein FMN transferase [Novipirellula aureliae]TWU43051.1 Thiamine biosynthesis lipoprotein ApbE precursor [Novipirellula aureliae]